MSITREQYLSVKKQIWDSGEFYTRPSGEYLGGGAVYESRGILMCYELDPSFKDLVRECLRRYTMLDYGDYYDINPHDIPQPTDDVPVPAAYGSYDTPFRSDEIIRDGTDEWRSLDGAIMVHMDRYWWRTTVYFRFED